MYKLYGMSKGKRLLDTSLEEDDIKDSLGMYLGILPEIDYEITYSKSINELEHKIVTIKSYEDYINYKYYGVKVKSLKRRI